jgi:uncharacterized protein YdhG (YjbR/CyaY superfamily)
MPGATYPLHFPVMAKSDAQTVEQYLEGLPEERRETISRVREVVRKHLPKGFREHMAWGMISYDLPLETYPDTYNKQPLSYAALAAQKNHYALYLTGVYGNPEKEKMLKDAFEKAGKKLDMGKSCLRFKKLEDIPLEAIGKVVGSMSVKEFIAQYEASRKK